MNKISKGTIIRGILVVLAIVNTALTVSGKSPLPFDEAWIENVVTIGFDAIVTWQAYWKNNSYTKNAITADKILKALKEGIITVDELVQKKGE